MWKINPGTAADGSPYYTVSAFANGDEIRFTVETEKEARYLRDVLNKLGTAVTSFAT